MVDIKVSVRHSTNRKIPLIRYVGYSSPRKLDVDHVVPLKEAHDSGAWQWTPEKQKTVCQLHEA